MTQSNPNESAEAVPARLRTVSSMVRLLVVIAIVMGVASMFAYAGGWMTSGKLTPARIVDTFQQVNGIHAGFRRNHAKGVCFSGYFDSNGQGQPWSKATIFQPGRVSIIGRFSFAGGQPYAADAPRTVRAMAILFKLPDGEQWRTGMLNIPVFTVQTPQQFYEQLLAGAPDRLTGKPDPAKMQSLIARYPAVGKAVKLIRACPVSSGFDNSNYNSLNAFFFINQKGVKTAVRWSMEPLQPFLPVQARQAGANYLFDALIARVRAGALQWRMLITIGQPHDPTNDATLPWSPDRQQIDAGTLTIDKIESEETSPARDINFDPLVLPNGITSSDDPLLSARSAAYAQSFLRREGERKEPSAVSAIEVAK